MKLTTLLIQFLADHHRLDLPGIGTFTLDPAILSQAADPKQKGPILEGIHFQSNPQLRENPELIDFISRYTGKMKSLASSDLESRIELAQQFLNIGKPFSFEGLGTLQRKMSGDVEFQPEFVLPPAVKPVATAESGETNQDSIASERSYHSFLEDRPQNKAVGRPVAAALVIGGILLAVVAGYFISRPDQAAPELATRVDRQEVTTEDNSAPQKEPPPVSSTTDSTHADSTNIANALAEGAINATDTMTGIVPAAAPVAAPAPHPGNAYKYVLEVAQSKRAFKRYNQLRTNLWQVQLETRDSIQYKLFLMIPTMYSDTTRILDSLMVMTGRRVYIEHQN